MRAIGLTSCFVLFTAPFNPEDGLVYGWSLRGAPHGSNAWRRYFRTGNETEAPKRVNADGHQYLHAVAPTDGFLPAIEDPRNFLAQFRPDAVGTYEFQLDVSNVCHARTFRFEATFECNAAPVPGALATPTDVGLCLARQEVRSNASDADGDSLFILWNRAFGPRGNGSKTFDDGTPTGARDASAGLYLTDHTGDVTGFMPDVPGEYSLRMTVTDGCLVTATGVDVAVDWSPECTALGVTANTLLTVLPVLTCVFFVAWSAWFLERTPFYRHHAAIAAERESVAAFREGEEGDEEDAVIAPLLRDGGESASEERGEDDSRRATRRSAADARSYRAAVFITFAVTLVVFPSVTSSICSASNPATAPPCVARPPGAGIASRLSGDLFAPTMFLLANACDFFGRRAAGAGTGGAGLKSPPRGWVLVVLSIARIALIPPLLMCNVVVEGSWGVRRALAGSDVWPVALVAAMSFTNGHLGSTCMMYGPSFVAPGKRGEEGAKLSLAVIGGLATGSVLSFALTAWLQS